LPAKQEHLDKSATIDLDTVPLDGGFLTKTLILSPEPYMRERMRDPKIQSYTTSFIVGAPIVGFALVEVLRSEKEGVPVGALMYGQTTWERYTVQPYIEGRVNFKPEDWAPHTFDMDSLALQVVPNPQGAFPLSHFSTALGTPGLTAYVGFHGLCKAKEGETIYVSSGASGVGSMIIQLAKLKGMKVIASAGSDAKVEYTRSLGADYAFNYKKKSYIDALKEYGPYEIFWDNVGGEVLEAVLDTIQPLGRIIYCGAASEYGVARNDRHPIRNTLLLFSKRLSLNGFIVPDLIPQFAGQFFQEIPGLLAQGKIKCKEYVVNGFDNAPQAIVDVLKGYDGVGKPVVVVDPASNAS